MLSSIQSQAVYGGSTYVCDANQLHTRPPVVMVPLLLSWMEERHSGPRNRMLMHEAEHLSSRSNAHRRKPSYLPL
jgi:hypothetical protein